MCCFPGHPMKSRHFSSPKKVATFVVFDPPARTFVPFMQKFVHHIAIGYIALLMLVKMLAMPIVYLEYALNKEYIAANLCENKDKPAMHCSGKCQLKKQLAKASETGDAQNQKGATQMPPADYCEEINPYSFSVIIPVAPSFVPYQAGSFPAGYKANVFHPPAPLA